MGKYQKINYKRQGREGMNYGYISEREYERISFRTGWKSVQKKEKKRKYNRMEWLRIMSGE